MYTIRYRISQIKIWCCIFKDNLCYFIQVYEPCKPCKGACSVFDCDPNCPADTQSVITFTLDNIQLDPDNSSSLYLLGKFKLGVIVCLYTPPTFGHSIIQHYSNIVHLLILPFRDDLTITLFQSDISFKLHSFVEQHRKM